MLFSFSLKSSFLLFFFLHGVIFSFLLLIKGIQNEDKSNRWLSLFTLLSALYIAPFMLGYAGWYSINPYREILFYTPFQQLFLIGPVLYFYFKSLLDKSFQFSKQDLWHFGPAFLYLFYSFVILIVDKMLLDQNYFYIDGKDKDFSLWYQVAGLVSLTSYLIKSLTLYSEYKRLTYNSISFADSVMFKWAQRFLIAFLILIAIRILFFILNPEWDEFGRKFWYYISFSILFYYISISGYTNYVFSSTLFQAVHPRSETDSNSQGIINQTDADNKDSLDAKQIERDHIPDLEGWMDKIESLMFDEKLYENPKLVISEVSNKLGTHPKKVSQVINQGFNMNFNDFVNHYRIKALLLKLEAGGHNLQTLLGLAYDCGFNSKSTFNRAFKRYTKMNPKDYIKKYHSK